MSEHDAEKGAPRVPEYTHRSNWRRAFCWWWGHVYVQAIEPITGQIELRCLRCYGGGTMPFRPTLTRVTPPTEGRA